jgi:hypothetical protein
LKYLSNVYYDQDIARNIFDRIRKNISNASFRSILIITKSLSKISLKNKELADDVLKRFDKLIEMNEIADKKKIKIDDNDKITAEGFINCVEYLNNLINFSFDTQLFYENLIINYINKEGIQSIHNIIQLIYLHRKLETKLIKKILEIDKLKQRRLCK